MATVGFLEYQDFHNELEKHGDSAWLARVQYYNEAIRAENAPLILISFYLIAAVQTDRDLLVLRFKIGESMEGLGRPNKIGQLRDEAIKAQQRLVQRLKTIPWLQVRKGLIPASLECKTEAEGLWDEEEDQP